MASFGLPCDAQFMNEALFQDLTHETWITSALLLCSLVQLMLNVGATMVTACVTGSGIVLSTNEFTRYFLTDYKAHIRMELSKCT